MMYADDNNNSFWHVGSGSDSSIPNDGQWTLNPRTTATLPADHPLAYWGIGYMNYLGAKNNQGGAKDVFNCPSHRIVDEWHDDARYYPHDFWKYSTYGTHSFLIMPYDHSLRAPLKVTDYKSPQSMIFAQDAAEQKMEGDTDSIGLFPGMPQILTQWIGVNGQGGLKDLYEGYDFTWEWYRHGKGCETLWVPGNVSRIPFTGLNKGVDYRWYTGDYPMNQPNF